MPNLCNCVPSVPPLPLLHCSPEIKPAGSDLLILKLCSYNFVDITDITEWTNAINTQNVIGIPFVKLSRPLPDMTTYTNAFGGKFVTGEIYKLAVEDVDMPYDPNTAAPAVDSRKQPLYDSMKWSPSQYNIGWLHKEGSVYGFYTMNGSTVTETFEDSSLNPRKFMGEIEFTMDTQMQPLPVALLTQLRQLFS